jgi:hypothetical protein
MLAVPLAQQFEQLLNARYLERDGYGLAAEPLDAATVGRFIEGLPDFERNLARYTQDGNNDLLAALDGSLARAKA